MRETHIRNTHIRDNTHERHTHERHTYERERHKRHTRVCMTHMCVMSPAPVSCERHKCETHIFIGKVVFICLVGSVNSVLKFVGQPGETRFQPGGDEISSGVPMTFSTKLTEPKGK